MEKVIRKVTFEEADQLDLEFWAGKTIQEKWEVLTKIRMEYNGENAKLERVITKVKYDR